jgi:hypothetical protein
MHPIYLALYLLAAVFFGLAAFNVASARVNFVALGLLAWVLVPLVVTLRAG